MKIALINTFDRNGGAAIAALRLHKGLRSLDQDSRMLVMQKSGQDPHVWQLDPPDEEFRRKGEIFHRIERQLFLEKRTELSNTRFSLPYPGHDLSQHLLVQGADIVNLHWVTLFQSVESIAALLEADQPVVWTLHDMNPFSGGCHYTAGCSGYRGDCRDCPQLRENELQLPAKILQTKKKLWRRNLTIVTPSRWLGACAMQSSVFGNFRVEVILNSLETDVFAPRDKAAAKEALGFDRGQFLLLFSTYSDREKRKGFPELMRALQCALKNRRFRELASSGRVQILNLGPAQDQIAGQGFAVSDLGVINAQDKLAAVYAAADVFVMPSLEENLANVMLEAMSCATPVLGYASGGTPEVVQNGVNGFLVPVAEVEPFAERLLELAFDRSLRERMGANCRLLIEKKFKLTDQAGCYLELYRDLLKKKRENPGHAAGPGTAGTASELKTNILQGCLEDLYRQTAATLPPHLGWRRFKSRRSRELRTIRHLLKNRGINYTVNAVVEKLRLGSSGAFRFLPSAFFQWWSREGRRPWPGARPRGKEESNSMADRKNLLFVQIQADLYGSSRSLLRLVGALDKKEFIPIVVMSGNGALKRLLEQNGARVIEIPHVGAVGRWNLFSWKFFLIPYEVMKATRRILQIIRSERVDLVHSNTSIILAAALAAKIAGVPHVYHVREIYDEFPLFWRIHRRFIRWSSREIICISSAVADQFSGQRARVIQNGLDIGAECPVRPDPDGLKKELGLDGALLAGCVGRIKWRRKGQEVLIRAVALLKERGLVMNALVVGSPFAGNESHRLQLQELARTLGVSGQVRFIEEQPDIWPFYALMDIFVMPSILPEPLGNVTMEAMAMGLPVIASRGGGTVDLVEDGCSGLLFAPGDSVELADKLAYLHQHPQKRREIGEAGRQRQIGEFPLSRCVGRIEALYRAILKMPAAENVHRP